MANPTPTQTGDLTPPSKYGHMAFDVFLAGRWDYAADTTQDKQQWDSLARQYLAMAPRERYPFHIESARRMASNYDATATTGSEAIITTRILPRFQTVQERIFCGHKITHESHPPALLRTYYGDVTGQDQDEVHKAMIGNAILNNLVGKDGTWNDKALYDFGDDWQRLLLRVPELCDQERHSSEEDYRESDHEENIEAPPAGDRDALEQWLWSRNVAIRLYVTDREAIESGKIKIFYLDTHGDAIWHHKFSADNLLEYNGAWNSMSLAEINACFSSSQENGCELFI